ncbi:MAG TPA: Gfo/Idh/MocA family oxidoreductase [Candidatus Brocadiia bacterium]|nr:Gfo/Idh/MocA family oxidoreductase [Candidatus Brocadiia bacterium]
MMQERKAITRRGFLKSAAAFAGAPYFISSNALGAPGRAPASDRLVIGFIGVGKMGKGVMGNALGQPDTQIVAVCDVWKVRQEWGKEHAESHYADLMSKGSYRGCDMYGDFRDITTREDIDAVMICSPPHWHALQAISAAQHGKDIFCEKPLARTIPQARAIVNAVRRHGRVLQTNTWQRADYNFRFACEMVRSGRVGRVHTVHVNVGGPSVVCDLPPQPTPEGLDWDMWLGPCPWRPYNDIICPPDTEGGWPQWRNYRDYDGGGMTDIGAHHFDIAQWGMGTELTGPVEIIPPNGKDVKLLTYIYADGTILYHGGGRSGIDFIGPKGRVMVNRGELSTDPPEIMKEETRPDEVHLYKSDNHLRDWIDCIRKRSRPLCHEEIGCRSVSICHLGNWAYWLKRPLKWDPDKEVFIGDEHANRLLEDSMRSPWRL